MSLCPNCSYQNHDGDSFCQMCGTPLGAHTEQGFTVPLDTRTAPLDARTEQGGLPPQVPFEGPTYAAPPYPDEVTVYPAPPYPAETPAYPAQQYPQPPQPKAPKQKNNLTQILVAVVLIVLILTVGAVVIFLKSHDKAQKDSTDAAEPSTTKSGAQVIIPATVPTAAAPTTTTEAPTTTTTAPTTTTTAPTTTTTAPATDGTAAASGYLFPSDTQLLTTAYLDTLSKNQIDLIRNEIYARHGYIFKKKQYRTYFESQSWYHGTEPDMDKVQQQFNDYELQNIEILVKYQGLAP
ncbi:MAG: YARHG domain-containing protein [Clostridia bacterium]|nr:YARHG domain-containing protein [Clostridia bacterium]